jgi:hypothetical protein
LTVLAERDCEIALLSTSRCRCAPTPARLFIRNEGPCDPSSLGGWDLNKNRVNTMTGLGRILLAYKRPPEPWVVLGSV